MDFVRFRVFNRHRAQQSVHSSLECNKHYYYVLYCPQRTCWDDLLYFRLNSSAWPDAQLTSLMSASASAQQKLPRLTAWPCSPPPSAPSPLTLTEAVALVCNGAEKLFSFSIYLLQWWVGERDMSRACSLRVSHLRGLYRSSGVKHFKSQREGGCTTADRIEILLVSWSDESPDSKSVCWWCQCLCKGGLSRRRPH